MLGNFLYKIITKIIADRLAMIPAKIVSYNQFGFVKGHRIEDCNVAALECFNLLDRKALEVLSILKLILERLLKLYLGLFLFMF